jgi:hypothetical protein
VTFGYGMIAALRNIPVARHFVFSLVVHFAILSFLLTVPIYGGGGESAGWYLVYLKNTADINRKEIQVKETRLKKTLPPNRDNIKDDLANRRTPVIPKSVKTTTDIKSASEEEMEKREMTNPGQDETAGEREMPAPQGRPEAAQKDVQVMADAKEKETPAVAAPQTKDGSTEGEQGRKLEVEHKSSPSNFEAGITQKIPSVPEEPKPALPSAPQKNPVQGRTVKEQEVPGPQVQPAVAKETVPVTSESKEKEVPEAEAPQVEEEPQEGEQGQQFESKAPLPNLEKRVDQGKSSVPGEQKPPSPAAPKTKNSIIKESPLPSLAGTDKSAGPGIKKSEEENPVNAVQKTANNESSRVMVPSRTNLMAGESRKGKIIVSTRRKGTSKNILSDNLLSAQTAKNPNMSSESGLHVKENKAANNEIKRDSKKSESEAGKPPVGISMPVALFLKDIKIEVSGAGEISGLSVRLLKRPYPADSMVNRAEKQEIGLTEEKEGDPNGAGSRTFSVSRAEKGIYTFLITNKAEKACDVDVVFRFYDGEPGARIKGYSAVRLLTGKIAKFMFVMPDMIFWDDEDRFSGVIEDSTSVTKFIYDSGLVWKEDKDF